MLLSNRILTTLGIAALCACSSSGKAFAGIFAGYNFTLNGTAAIDGANLQLINNQGGAAGTAFITAPFILTPNTSFKSSFSFEVSNNGTYQPNEFSPYAGNTASFFFNINNCSDATYGGGGDCAQIRADFGSDESYVQNSANLTIPNGIAQIQQNGGGGPYSPAIPFNLQNNFSLTGPAPYDVVTGTATVAYDSVKQLFYLKAVDSVGGAADISMLFNLFGDLDTNGNVFQPPPYGFVGFGAFTGGQFSQVEISKFSFQSFNGGLPTTSSTPEPAFGGLLVAGLAGIFWLRRRSIAGSAR